MTKANIVYKKQMQHYVAGLDISINNINSEIDFIKKEIAFKKLSLAHVSKSLKAFQKQKTVSLKQIREIK